MFAEKPDREEVLEWVREEIRQAHINLTEERMWLMALYQVILELQAEIRKLKGEHLGETYEQPN